MQRLEGGARCLLKADFKAGLVSGPKGDQSEKTSSIVGGGGGKDSGGDAGGWREELEPESWSRFLHTITRKRHLSQQEMDAHAAAKRSHIIWPLARPSRRQLWGREARADALLPSWRT